MDGAHEGTYIESVHPVNFLCKHDGGLVADIGGQVYCTGENMFTVQACCLRDWTKIMARGAWLFWDFAVIIVPYDGLALVETLKLNRIVVWAQIWRRRLYCGARAIRCWRHG